MNNIRFLLVVILLMINLGSAYCFMLANPLKISEQTSIRLLFTIRPKVFLGLGIFFSQLAVFYLFIIFMITPITQLTCDRSPNNISNINGSESQNKLSVICTLTENDWFGSEKTRILISELYEAKLETQIETNSQGQPEYWYQVLLLTDVGSIPFAHKMPNRFKIETMQSIASTINNFLVSSTEESLAVKNDDSIANYIIFIVALFWGLVAFLLAAAGLFIHCNFDKEANTLKITRYRWFGKLKRTVFQSSLNEITDVKVERIDTSIDKFYSRVILLLESGDSLLLTPDYTEYYIDGGYIVKLVKNFLKSK